MRRPLACGAAIACATILASLPVLAADTVPWPWTEKTPPDLALATLSRIDGVTAKIDELDPPTLHVSVEATAPTPGFTELKLAPLMGDPHDRIFTFEAKGRPPQDVTTQVLTPVTLAADYTDAPVASIDVIEVRSTDNCEAFSLKEKKAVPCITKPLSGDTVE